MKIKTKLLIAPAVIMVFFLISSFFIYRSLNNVIETKDALSFEATEMETILNMRIDSGNIRRSVGEILLGEDRFDDLSVAWDSFYKNSSDLHNLLEGVDTEDFDDELISEKSSTDLLVDIEKDSKDIQAAVYQIIDNYKAGNLELAKEEYENVDISFDHFSEQLMSLSKDNSTEIASLGILVTASQSWTFWFLISIIILVVVITIFLSLINAKLIAQELNRIKLATADILQGNLKHRIENISQDEVGDLASDFNKMIDRVDESNASLEKKVAEKTADLQKKLEELDKVNQTLKKTSEAMINRELKMAELKEEIKKNKPK